MYTHPVLLSLSGYVLIPVRHGIYNNVHLQIPHRPGNSDKQIEKIGDAITYLRESRQEILTEAVLKKDTRDRIENMMNFLDDQICAVTEYSETLTRRLIEKVTVYDEKMLSSSDQGFRLK